MSLNNSQQRPKRPRPAHRLGLTFARACSARLYTFKALRAAIKNDHAAEMLRRHLEFKTRIAP